jgi:hypothetical protein
MADKPKQPEPKDAERVKIPLDPEVALRALLKVDPESEPVRAKRIPPPRKAAG